MNRTIPPIPRRRVLMITALALVIVFLLWNNPLRWGVIDLIMSPLRLFVTFIHEASHSLAALISGGEVLKFQVSADGSGVATTAGGSRALILAAGYLGAALFGSVLFFVVNRMPRYIDMIAFALGMFMIGFTLMFALPDQSGNPLAMVLGIGFGALLIFLGAKANLIVDLLVLNVLAVMTALNAVFDVWGDLVTYGDTFSRFGVRTDAIAFSQDIAPILPPVLVGIIWSALAVVMLGISAYYALWKPLHAEVNEAYQRVRE